MLVVPLGKFADSVCVEVWRVSGKTSMSVAVVLASLAWATCVRADCSALPMSSRLSTDLTAVFARPAPVMSSQPSWATGAPATLVPTCTQTGVSIDGLGIDALQDIEAPLSSLRGEVPSSFPQEVIDLPPAPSSTALFMSALVCGGAWHVCRSARHLHRGALPDWYHTGGPDRIGQSVRLDVRLTALPPCSFEQPVGACSRHYRVQRGTEPRRSEQGSFVIAAPRGPPLHSP